MADQLLVVKPIYNSPYKERYIGRITILQREEYLSVYLDRLDYPLTNDLVYAERNRQHIFSSWPLIYDVITIIRIYMILDDLAGSQR